VDNTAPSPMPKHNLNYYLLKLARLTGWLLLPIMLVYIATGFALCGILGFGRLIDSQTAVAIHKFFDWPLVALFLVHVSVTIYFAMWRWGWIKRRNCP
jgi:succinate dehydrogenase/fumarate reductase cytochrome b subunit